MRRKRDGSMTGQKKLFAGVVAISQTALFQQGKQLSTAHKCLGVSGLFRGPFKLTPEGSEIQKDKGGGLQLIYLIFFR